MDRLARMKPSSNVDWILTELGRVSELQEALRFDDPIPLHRISDIRSAVQRAMPEGSMLSPEDLAAVHQTLATARRLREYFDKRRGKFAGLFRVATRLVSLPDLEDRIESVVDPEGRVRDDASAELLRLRRLVVQRQAELREALQRELRTAMKSGYASEEKPTLRNGRMVIPIRAEAKRKIEGFVHDTSASGQTVYIEPTACLNLNNDVRVLEGEERREVERILREVTDDVRKRIDALGGNLRVLSVFDLLQSKARLSNETEAIVPNINDAGIIDLVGARNPVLQLHFRASDLAGAAREVVPLSLSLGRQHITLVITGPNAGGKTVAMKTVGLFALMISYGLPIPVDERSEFSSFDELFVDLGDEQSIEEDLSTFSSHISNLKEMLERAGERSLVLIDEAGTGTDPAEGGALAQAVLETLTRLGSRTIATTHHGTLKAFAHEAAGVENGSMEFDQATLSPTYRFQPDIPGSSYAFEIARRIGFDEEILSNAVHLVGAQKATLENLITTFESRRQKLDARLATAEEEIRKATHERQKHHRRVEKLQRERDDIRRQALEEAERIVSSANARIEQTIREIREAEAERDSTKAARQKLETFQAHITEQLEGGSRREGDREDTGRALEGELREQRRMGRKSHSHGSIEVGDQVVLDDGSTTAEVLDIDEGEAVISFDSMRVRAAIARLRKVGGRREQQVRLGRIETSAIGEGSVSARTRMDLRGFRVEEALSAVMRLIDEALAANLHHLEILHGTGTGALRSAIHDYLSRREEVTTFDEAPWDQGGAGVTRVALR